MAISLGGHLVFGDAGHLKRSSVNDHLLRRDSIIVSSPSLLKVGSNAYDVYVDQGVSPARSDLYPAIFDNKYDVTWSNGSAFQADSGWALFDWQRFSLYYRAAYAQSNASYAAYDTSSINGTSVNSVLLNVTSYTAASGGGAFSAQALATWGDIPRPVKRGWHCDNAGAHEGGAALCAIRTALEREFGCVCAACSSNYYSGCAGIPITVLCSVPLAYLAHVEPSAS
jgi:hypothetical protein